jgi:ATP-dependent Clp protease ATP-binding subunit ClpA
MGHHYIGTEHLLLGLLRQNKDIAVEVLKRLNISPEEVRRQIRRVLQEVPQATIQPPSAISGAPPAKMQPLSPASPQPKISQPSRKINLRRLTPAARNVFQFAREEAERMQLSAVGAEHLLLGMIREEHGVAGRVLYNLGVKTRDVEPLVKNATQPQQREPSVRPELSPDARQVLRSAIAEARRLGPYYLGTEHLMLGLLLQSDSAAINILKQLNIDLEKMRAQTLNERKAHYPKLRLRFAQTASRVMAFAHEEAEKMHQAHIGTEHLLLGLVREENSVGGRILRELGLSREAIEQLLGNPIAEQAVPNIVLELSPGTKRVIQSAIDEARSMGNRLVDTDHLLLGLLHENEGVAADILKRLKLGPDQVRRRRRKILLGSSFLSSGKETLGDS